MQTALLDNENVHSYLLNILNIINYYSNKQTTKQPITIVGSNPRSINISL